jgi:hypothetical protein
VDHEDQKQACEVALSGVAGCCLNTLCEPDLPAPQTREQIE